MQRARNYPSVHDKDARLCRPNWELSPTQEKETVHYCLQYEGRPWALRRNTRIRGPKAPKGWTFAILYNSPTNKDWAWTLQRTVLLRASCRDTESDIQNGVAGRSYTLWTTVEIPMIRIPLPREWKWFIWKYIVEIYRWTCSLSIMQAFSCFWMFITKGDTHRKQRYPSPRGGLHSWGWEEKHCGSLERGAPGVSGQVRQVAAENNFPKPRSKTTSLRVIQVPRR